AMARRRYFALERLQTSAPPLPAGEKLILVTTLINELARVSASAAKVVLDNNFGQVPLLELFGGEDIRARYLPRIRSGRAQLAFLFTEPDSGSELARLQCTVKRIRGGFALSGSKDWVSGAQQRSLYL